MHQYNCSLLITQSMQLFQHPNPYELLYRGLNLQIGQSSSRKDAEEVARQLAFMHNALGIVAKDLIKMLSIKFSKQPTSPSSQNLQNSSEERPVRAACQAKHKDENEMDIQINPKSQESSTTFESCLAFKRKQKDSVVIDIISEQNSISEKHQQNNLDAQPQPTDSYLPYPVMEKTPHQKDLGSLNKSSVILKQQMSKIIEKVSSKKKHSIVASQENLHQKQFDSVIRNGDSYGNSSYPVQGNNDLFIQQKEFQNTTSWENVIQGMCHNPISFCQEPKANHQQPDLEFSIGGQKIENEAIVIPNVLFELFRQKPKPIIYQISDDE